MSVEINVKQWTVQNTATSLTTILGLPLRQFNSLITVRNSHASVGNIYWGKSNVTNVPANAGGYIQPGESVSFEFVDKFLSSSTLFFVGTTNDVAYISVFD